MGPKQTTYVSSQGNTFFIGTDRDEVAEAGDVGGAAPLNPRTVQNLDQYEREMEARGYDFVHLDEGK